MAGKSIGASFGQWPATPRRNSPAAITELPSEKGDGTPRRNVGASENRAQGGPESALDWPGPQPCTIPCLMSVEKSRRGADSGKALPSLTVTRLPNAASTGQGREARSGDSTWPGQEDQPGGECPPHSVWTGFCAGQLREKGGRRRGAAALSAPDSEPSNDRSLGSRRGRWDGGTGAQGQTPQP